MIPPYEEWIEKRVAAIMVAIQLSLEIGKPVPEEWTNELLQHLRLNRLVRRMQQEPADA
jgi:hypothetical protein